MNLKSVHNIYFIGIGGIGMSALAKYFLAVGKKVGGYDIKPSLSTDSLIELGVSIQFEANSSMIDEIFSDPLNTLIVFTPAIPQANSLLNYFKTAFVYWIISIVGLLVAYYYLTENLFSSVIFLVLFAVTAPHVWVMNRMKK